MENSMNKINRFEKWALEVQYNLMINEMFRPIGLELSCLDLIFETKDNYSFQQEFEKDPEHCPLAWNNTMTDKIHVFVDHPVWEVKIGDESKKAFLLFLLCHEAEHSLLLHKTRGQEYDPTLFNIAGDMEIHNMFYVYNEIIKANPMEVKDAPLYGPFTNYVAKMLFNKPTGKKKKDEQDLEQAWSGLWEEEYLDMTAEEIYASLKNSAQVETTSYDLMMDDGNMGEDGDSDGDGADGNSKDSKNKKDSDGKDGKKKNKNQGSGNSQRVTITKTTYTSKGGNKYTTVTVNFPETNKSGQSDEDRDREKEREHGKMTRNALSKSILQKKLDEMNEDSKGRGTLPSCCKNFLKKLLKVKIDWKKILKNSIVTAMEKDEYFSWAKPRTSLFGLDYDVYLPDQIESEASYGTLIVARDESGSMSDDDCRKAAAVIKESKEYYKKVIVLKHDTEISTVDELSDDNVSDLEEKLLLTRTAEGGTSHQKVFEYIRDYNKKHEEGDPERISACIFITDMQSDIEQTQDIAPVNIPRIWLVPKADIEYAKSQENVVSGKIIPLE